MTTRETDTSHGDWVQYYQRDVAPQPPGGGGGSGHTGATFDSHLAYSTVVTTTVAPAASSAAVSGGGGPQPAGEGRAVRATSRRRSRASRKAPTNLINTDAANFRDMVQRYTGAPQGAFPAGYLEAAGGAGGGLGFAISGGTALPPQPASFPYGAQQQQQYLQYLQRHERPPFTLGGGAGDADLFQQGFGGGQPQRGDVEVSEGYLMEGISSSQLLPRAPASGGGRTTGGFFL